MRIFTLTCPNCGTIVAANELEAKRSMVCPGVDCQKELRFNQLPEEWRDYILQNRERYQI